MRCDIVGSKFDYQLGKKLESYILRHNVTKVNEYVQPGCSKLSKNLQTSEFNIADCLGLRLRHAQKGTEVSQWHTGACSDQMSFLPPPMTHMATSGN